MSKRDDDSQADMEVGMTTAERRRRRRRGGGLRVPSDNVPRRTTTPPVVPPVPEDPSLAMSIAYSFTNDASEPIPRVAMDTPSSDVEPNNSEPNNNSAPIAFPEPTAPEPMQTVIDPPSSPVESVDFEMKTREMSSVDLEALGLQSMQVTDPAESKSRASMESESVEPRESIESSDSVESIDSRDSSESLDSMEIESMEIEARDDTEPPVDVDVDMTGFEGPTIDTETPEAAIPTLIPTDTSSAPVSPIAPREHRERLKTVALSEDDLEEVRDAVRAATQPAVAPPAPTPPAPPQTARTTTGETAPPPVAAIEPAPPSASPSNQTQPLTALDVEVVKTESDEPQSVPEIDIQELSDRAASASGEIEVDVGEESDDETKAAAAAPEAKRVRPPSVPPPVGGHVAPPPPPPAAQADKAHKPPPAPPPKKAESPKPAPRVPVEPKSPRGKPWFVDLFDEDYLRTLPFLTPQATQAEAEFVIDTMGLSPGAQVLDVGCGYGRHAMELAARGFHVVGLDLSTPLLVRGGEESHRRGLSINFIRGDMRELDFDGQFDAAYCLFSTFGYFDDETNKKTVANIARALKPGGKVLIEILNRDYVIADLPTRVWWEGDGCVVLEEVELNYFSSRIQVNRSVVFDDGRQLEQEISLRAYSLHEVGKLMHSAGFRVLEVSGAYHTRGRFFGNQSRHIIVLAERKDAQPAS